MAVRLGAAAIRKTMRNIGGHSKYIGFLDESGDHSLQKLDADFPLFVLAMAIIERKAYVERIIPTLGRLKLRYWNHEGVNLHSRDIRKATGSYSFLQNPQWRPQFLADVSEFADQMPFTLFITCIRKQTHIERYGKNALSPYDLALEFTMERVAHFLKGERETELPLVAEARGTREDADLERVFYRILSQGTNYRPAEEMRDLKCPLVFRSKRDNIAGIQIADLSAYPCARHILNSSQKNAAYEIIKKHLYSREGVNGWKVFP